LTGKKYSAAQGLLRFLKNKEFFIDVDIIFFFSSQKKKWIKKAGVVSIERESLVVVVVALPNFGFAGR
jgi:hypothetical protein